MKNKNIDVMWKYVIFTYLLFWFIVLGVIGGAIFIFDAPDAVVKALMVISSWTPTIVLLIMMKRLIPGTSIKEFYKKAFKQKLNFPVFLFATLLIVGVFVVSTLGLSIFEKTSVSGQLQFVLSMLIGNILITTFQGASGEESGWRGYLMPKMESKYGFVKGNLILGLVWAFWHLPLWFVSANYQGLQLLLYIITFIVGLVSFSIIMSIFMKKCNNLFLAFWLHFWFNFVLTFFIGKDVYLLCFYAILYSLVAFILVYFHLKKHNIREIVDETNS